MIKYYSTCVLSYECIEGMIFFNRMVAALYTDDRLLLLLQIGSLNQLPREAQSMLQFIHEDDSSACSAYGHHYVHTYRLACPLLAPPYKRLHACRQNNNA